MAPSHAEVAAVVEDILGVGARVLDWSTVPLGPGSGGNPTTADLRRVHGHARQGRMRTRWSVIAKTVATPPPMSGLDMGAEPGHWNYWAREPLLHASGLLGDLPAGVAAPALHHVAALEDGRVRMWTEDLGPPGGRWDGRHYTLAARHLGRLGGTFLERSRWDRPWLRGSLVAQWCADIPRLSSTVFAAGDVAAHPALRALVPEPEARALGALLRRRDELLGALAGLPQTLCHRDFARENLWSRRSARGGETVAIDWALAGPGVLGEDLGTLALSAWEDLGGPAWRHAAAALLAAYVEGLGDVGAHVDPAAVAFAADATAALRYLLYELFLLDRSLQEGRPARPAARGRLAHLAGLGASTLARLDRPSGAAPAERPPAARRPSHLSATA